MGKLMYASPYIPAFKRLIRPIEALLGRKEELRWDRECTEALNALLAWVERSVRLFPASMGGILRFYPSICGGTVFVAVMEVVLGDGV